MPSSIELLSLQAALHHPRPPAVIVQRPKHFGPADLYHSILTQGAGAITPELLTVFCNDLMNHHHLQPDLVRFLLPYCLIGWKQALCEAEAHLTPMASHLWGGLESPHFKRAQWFTDEEWHAVRTFMRNAILEHMADQKTLHADGAQLDPHRWMRHFASYCVVFPDLEPLWNTWWSLTQVGFAYCAIQYLSRVFYRDEENPIFNPTADPFESISPRLWDTDHPGNGWDKHNAAFLERVFTPSFVTAKLGQAIRAISQSTSQHAALLHHVHTTAAAESERIALRLVTLPRMVQNPILSYEGWMEDFYSVA